MRLSWLIAALTLCAARPAAATYSIVAADTTTGQVGGSGTSCIDGADVYIIYGSAPGLGVVHAQASVNYDGRDRAVELLEQGVAPQAIIDEITSFDFDPGSGSRQYGIADVMGRTAGFTGQSAQDYAGDVQGQTGSFSYSVQGNILTSEAVLSQAAEAFEASGCDLAERLMLALEAGADNGEGDNRCTGDGIPSDSAYLQVELPGEEAGDYLSLRVPTSGNESPLIELRADYDTWRATHPCPMSPDPGMGGAGGVGGSGGAGGAAESGAGGSTSAGGTAGDPGSGGRAGNAGQAGSAAGAGNESEASTAADPGCACRAGGATRPASAALALPLLAFVARRRLRAGRARSW